MEFYRQNTIKVIKGLVHNCYNIENLFRKSSRNLEDKTLNKIFLQYADLCKDYIIKLENEIERLGGSVDEFYQENIMFNSDKTGYQGNLEICEDAVKTVLKNYREISLREDILWEVVPIISMQYTGVAKAHETIKNINTKMVA